MQRGRPVNTRTDTQPSVYHIYNKICKELEKVKLERYRIMDELTGFKISEKSEYKNALVERAQILGIQQDLLDNLKADIENPKYYDEVYDGNS